MKYITLVLFCVTVLYSCSLNDFFESNSTYKENVTIGDFLYQVESNLLTTFDISDPDDIEFLDEKQLNARIESLTSFGDVLFVGSGGSLISFKINDQGIPTEDDVIPQSTFSSDQTECDPMVVDDNLAFVALIELEMPEQGCNRSMNNNRILIYDIEELSSPTLLSTSNHSDLKDIDITENLLIVADGIKGFYIFDRSDPSELMLRYHIDDFTSKHIIVNDNLFIIAGDTELRQYDYSDIDNIIEVSRIIL